MLSTKKLVIAGNTLHYYAYNYPQKYGTQSKPKTKYTRNYQEDNEEGDPSNQWRTEKSIKRLIQSNVQQYRDKNAKFFRPIFVTLTFKENVTELSQANPLFTKFIKRLNYFVTGSKSATLKYLVVPEFQKKTRQAVHYHILFFNLPYVEKVYDEFNRVWGQGNVNVKTIWNNPNHIANYVTKYITKQEQDERTFNKKSYFTSRGLLKPQEVREENLVGVLIDVLEKYKPLYVKQFHSGSLVTDYQCLNISIQEKEKISSLLGFLRSSFLPPLSHYFPPVQQELTLQLAQIG